MSDRYTVITPDTVRRLNPIKEEEFNVFLQSLKPGIMPNSVEITTPEGYEIFQRMLTNGCVFRGE